MSVCVSGFRYDNDNAKTETRRKFIPVPKYTLFTLQRTDQILGFIPSELPNLRFIVFELSRPQTEKLKPMAHFVLWRP